MLLSFCCSLAIQPTSKSAEEEQEEEEEVLVESEEEITVGSEEETEGVSQEGIVVDAGGDVIGPGEIESGEVESEVGAEATEAEDITLILE